MELITEELADLSEAERWFFIREVARLNPGFAHQLLQRTKERRTFHRDARVTVPIEGGAVPKQLAG